MLKVAGILGLHLQLMDKVIVSLFLRSFAHWLQLIKCIITATAAQEQVDEVGHRSCISAYVRLR